MLRVVDPKERGLWLKDSSGAPPPFDMCLPRNELQMHISLQTGKWACNRVLGKGRDVDSVTILLPEIT